MLPDGTTHFVKAVVDINTVQLDLLANRAPQLGAEELQKLRVNLMDKFSLAKAHVEHSMLSYGRLAEDYVDLEHSLSDVFILKKLEELSKNLLTAKKRINELSKKRKEIEEINSAIDTFNGSDTIQLTEEELVEVFGGDSDKLKDSKHISKREVGGQVEYSFTANLSKPVAELTKIQESLQTSIDEYTAEIGTLKESYMDKMAKFEQIKKIMGVEQGHGEEEQQDQEDLEEELSEIEEHLHESEEDEEEKDDTQDKDQGVEGKYVEDSETATRDAMDVDVDEV